MHWIRTMTLAGGTAILGAMAWGQTVTLEPENEDLDGLDHYYAYEWGINKNTPTGKTITGAILKIEDIFDWTVESNDILQVRLVDNLATGVRSYYDNEASGDYFRTKGVAVGTWSDPYGGSSRNYNLTFDLGKLGLLDTLNSYAADGKFGFTFDPDCHYWNDGVTLTLTYGAASPVPEPGTFLILGSAGVLGAAAKRRRGQRRSSR